MKKLKYWLITVFMLLPMMVSAYDFEMGGIYYNITSEDDLMVEVTYKSYYNSYQGEIIIPSTVTYKEKAYSVASIGDEAFTECISLTSVTIPGSVKSIGAVSFANCYNLTSITIPESVTRIGDYAFYACENLASITIPESVTRIGIEAFNYCTSLPIENHIYYADKWAVGVDDKTLVRYTLKSDTRGLSGTFEGCENLVYITIPESVTSIGAYTFMSTGLTSVTIPNSVTDIGESAFSWCSSLTSVHISDIAAWCNITFASSYSNPLLYAHHLYKDGKEITNLEIPEGVTVINNRAFEGCTGLISVTIPEGVTKIGSSAFEGCSRLTSITIPNSVTGIGSSAFYGCSNITSITIPESITSIGDEAFSHIITVTINSSAVMKAGDFKNIFGTQVTTYNIGAEIEELKNALFVGYTNLKTVTLPETLIKIGESAFDQCSALKTITIPSKVNSIGAYAFAGCSSLNSVTCANSVPPVCAAGVFESVPTSTCNLYVPKASVNTYKETSPWSDFNEIVGYNVIEKITFADAKVKKICVANWDTDGDGELSIEEAAAVSNLGWVFEENEEIKTFNELQYFTGLTTITSEFYDCISLTSVIIPSSVTSIGKDAFHGCSSLTLITIPNSVTNIGESAFEGCGLTSVTIPNSVTSIGKYAFKGCDNLINVTVESNTPISLVNDATFTSSYKATLYVPLGCKDAYEQAQYWSNFREIVEIQPTEVTISINEYGSGTYSSGYALDFTKVEGMKAYVGVGFNTETMTLLMSAVKTTQPELGLYIKGAPGEYKVPIIEKSKENYINLLVGSVENTIVNKNSNDGKYTNYKYTMKTGDEGPRFYEFADGSTSKANKAYLQLPSEWISSISTSKSINLIFDDEEVTGINEFKTERPKNDNYMFDMQGRRVVNLSKGFYIVNGKKVVIK